MFVVGVDPDCVKSGFAFYKGGRLVSLRNWSFVDFIEVVNKHLPENNMTPENTIFVVEDGTKIKTIYQKHRDKNSNVYAEKARNVGRVQQMGLCIIDMLNSNGYNVVRERPQRGNWADPKMLSQFKAVTGWKKRSNPETRSAAFFGFLHKDKKLC